MKAKHADVVVYAEQADILGEGPLWSETEQALYWLDIGRKVLYRKAPEDVQSRSWSLPEYPGCLASVTPGAIAVAMGEGVHQLDLESGLTTLLCGVSPRRFGTRFNDGKVDPRGRFWVSTMQNNFDSDGASVPIERADGALYRCDLDGHVHLVEEDIGVSNTLAWSPDSKHFYFADSLRRQIYVYDFDADLGEARNKRLFFDSSKYGIPDGSAIDVDGCLWNASLDNGAVLRITPEGKLDQRIELPVPRPTCCIFGGPNLDILYVSSASLGLSDEQLQAFPLSGSMFAVLGLGQGMHIPPFALCAH